MIPPSGEQFELALGDQRAVVVELGGGLREYTRGGLDVLDGYAVDAMCTSGRGQLLVPWPNRLRHGAYEFEGRRHQLALTEPENGNAIHGLVRWARWRLAEREPHRIVLEHTLHPQPGYPFALALHVEYALSPDGLSVRTRAQNVGRDACPYGAGAHPYLTLGTPVVDALELRVPASTVLLPDDDGHRDASGARRRRRSSTFARTGRSAPTTLDNAYADLERGDDGLARVELRHGDSGLDVWMDESYGYVMVFTGDPLPDVNRRSIAVEPMTCPPNAFRTGVDVIRLEPGKSSRARSASRSTHDPHFVAADLAVLDRQLDAPLAFVREVARLLHAVDLVHLAVDRPSPRSTHSPSPNSKSKPSPDEPQTRHVASSSTPRKVRSGVTHSTSGATSSSSPLWSPVLTAASTAARNLVAISSSADILDRV